MFFNLIICIRLIDTEGDSIELGRIGSQHLGKSYSQKNIEEQKPLRHDGRQTSLVNLAKIESNQRSLTNLHEVQIGFENDKRENANVDDNYRNSFQLNQSFDKALDEMQKAVK